jgi:tRNA A-37 threonylcarbamoyl transferase component Bud32
VPALTRGSVVLSRDGRGPKVYRLADGRIFKLFPFRGRLKTPSARRARRFAEVTRRMLSLDVDAPRVESVVDVTDRPVAGVVYEETPGEDMSRALADPGSDPRAIVAQVGRFVARLHALGVYCRNVHWQNMLLRDDGAVALIDCDDARFSRRPLGAWRRARNFRWLLTRWDAEGPAANARFEDLLAAYLGAWDPSAIQERRFLGHLARIVPGSVEGLNRAAAGL